GSEGGVPSDSRRGGLPARRRRRANQTTGPCPASFIVPTGPGDSFSVTAAAAVGQDAGWYNEAARRRTVMSSDEMRLQDYLDGRPDDVEARLVLADLLEEAGREEEAALQRWLARNHRWPDGDLAFYQIDGWHWWSTVSSEHGHRAHALI